jgi:hypothetical protein
LVLAAGVPGYGQVARVDESRLTTLKGSTHRLAQSRFDKGVAPDTLRLDGMQLVLTRSAGQEADLKALLEAQQDAHSSDYHSWLTPEEFGKRFGVAESDIAVVVSWLKSHSFHVDKVGKGGTVVQFSGIAGQVKNAFHTEIHKYVIGEEEHWANASDQQIPEALAGVVAGVAVLHDFKAKPLIRVGGKIAAVRDTASPRPKYDFSPGVYALAPADFATIYNLNPLYTAGIDGTGVVIGVIGVDGVESDDVQSFQAAFGLPSRAPTIVTNGIAPVDWDSANLEGTLDVEWSGAVAPGASILYISSPDNSILDALALSEQYAVDDNAEDVLTESYGICEADMTAAQAQQTEAVREQAAAQGVTWLVSSGDTGPYCDDHGFTSADIGTLTVNGLASSPYVVAVGGTEFSSATNTSAFWAPSNNATTSGSAKSYLPEIVWNDSCTPAACGDNANIGASGGGASALFDKPSWQAGVPGIPTDGKRDMPDVSLTASAYEDPYLICYNLACQIFGQTSFLAIGGTSASAPTFAGMMALLVQKEKSRQGAVNSVLYRLAAAERYSECVAYDAALVTQLPASSCVFNDVTTGNNAVPGEPNYGLPSALYQAGSGYDQATGLGSVNAANLINRWSSIALHPTTTTLTAAPAKFEHGSPVTIQVSVAPQSGGGVPTGDVALVTPAGPYAGVYPLVNGVANFVTSSLPGGTYNLTARYSGDGTFAASTSAAVPLNITPEPVNVSGGYFVSTQDPSAFYLGGPYATADVSLRANVTGRSGQGVPTGNVSIFVTAPSAANNVNGVLTINSRGEAVDPNPGILGVGTWQVLANYDGDASFQPGSASSPLVAITRAPTTLWVTPSADIIVAGQQTCLTATVGFPGQVATGLPLAGTVTLFANGQQLGQPLPPFGNYATCPTLPLGANIVTATFSGDSNYLPSSTDVGVTVNVVSVAPPCAVNEFIANPNPVFYGDPAGTTTLSLYSPCAFDIRVGSPSGTLVVSGPANPLLVFKITVGPSITNGTTFYLQEAGNTTPQGTLQTIVMSVISTPPPCLVYGFSASPNPVVTASPPGVTTIFGYASCAFDIRIGGPGGKLFTSGSADGNGGFTVSAATGNWVSNGMQFFMQQAGNTTPQGTLGSLAVPVVPTLPLCDVTQFSASPTMVFPLEAETPTVQLTAVAGCAFDIRIGSPSGLLYGSAIGNLTEEVYPSVIGPSAYYLQLSGNTTSAGTLGEVVVIALPVNHSLPPPGDGPR